MELSLYRLHKAKDDLESAKIMLDSKKYSQSLNRSYYAIFHATRALLALDKFDSKKHSGIISFFNQNYIKSGKLDIKLGQILMKAEKIRIHSDYDDFYIAGKEQAFAQLKEAEDFIDIIANYLRKL